jgi:hypothetical protein
MNNVSDQVGHGNICRIQIRINNMDLDLEKIFAKKMAILLD